MAAFIPFPIVSDAVFLVASIGAAIIVAAIVVVVGFALRYQKKRKNISDMAKSQVDSLHQRLLQAEKQIVSIKASQAIPSSFLISESDLQLDSEP